MPRTTAKKSEPSLGQEIIAGLTDAVATAKAGGMAALRRKYTMRQVKRTPFRHPEFGPDDIAAIRNSLRASQAVFAILIGVSAGTVRSWEQGRKTPSTMARCLLAEVKRNHGYWEKMLRLVEETECSPRVCMPPQRRLEWTRKKKTT